MVLGLCVFLKGLIRKCLIFKNVQEQNKAQSGNLIREHGEDTCEGQTRQTWGQDKTSDEDRRDREGHRSLKMKEKEETSGGEGLRPPPVLPSPDQTEELQIQLSCWNQFCLS